MYASLADRSSRLLVNRLAKVELLVIDEMGYPRRCASTYFIRPRLF
ncbi:MAG: hypothetical protein ACLP1X_26355 [Polyangiaceae bacterium]